MGCIAGRPGRFSEYFCSGVYTLASGDRLTAAEGGFELAVPLAVESVSPAGGKRASTTTPSAQLLKPVGLAQPDDNDKGNGGGHHQEEGGRKVVVAVLDRIDGDDRREPADDTLVEVEPHRGDRATHRARGYFRPSSPGQLSRKP